MLKLRLKSKIMLFIFLSSFSYLQAQEYQVPTDYHLEEAADYDNHKDDFIEGVNWLISNPPDQEVPKRKAISQFLMQWMSGTPLVTVELNANILTFAESSPDLFMIYMASWTKAGLESGEKENMIEGNMAGLNAAIDYYIAHKDKLGKDSNMEKYKKLRAKGKLKAFVEENV